MRTSSLRIRRVTLFVTVARHVVGTLTTSRGGLAHILKPDVEALMSSDRVGTTYSFSVWPDCFWLVAAWICSRECSGSQVAQAVGAIPTSQRTGNRNQATPGDRTATPEC